MKTAQIENLAEEIVAGLKSEIKEVLTTVADPNTRPSLAHMEFLVQRLLLGKARKVMQATVESIGPAYKGAYLPCYCGGALRFHGYRQRYIKTILGEVNLRGAYYTEYRK